MNWTPEQLAERMAANPALRVQGNPLSDASDSEPSRTVGPKASKYHNIKTEVDGIVFDSKKEAARYQDLKRLERARKIELLRCQVPFDLVINGVKVARYVADFGYMDRGSNQVVIEDCKGVRTPVYKLKRKLMKAIHGIDILET